MPSIGSLIYDEIHLKINGDKAYLLVALDSFTRFVVRSEITLSKEKAEIKQFFQNIRLVQNIKIDSVVHDGCNSGWSAFQDRSLKNITQGRCHTHFKWNVREKVYAAAGLGKKMTQTLPYLYFRFLKLLYYAIGAIDDFKFWTRIEMARSIADTIGNDDLYTIIGFVETNQQSLQNWYRMEYLAKSTALVESINHEIENYPVYKHGEHTINGAIFCSESRIYMHNMREITRLPAKLEKEQRYLDFLHEQHGYCSEIISKKIKFGHFKKKCMAYMQSMDEYWIATFPKDTLNLFKKHWGGHH
jgi:hypothetical protein